MGGGLCDCGGQRRCDRLTDEPWGRLGLKKDTGECACELRKWTSPKIPVYLLNGAPSLGRSHNNDNTAVSKLVRVLFSWVSFYVGLQADKEVSK